MTRLTKRVILSGLAAAAVAGTVLLLRPPPIRVETARVTRGELSVSIEEEGKTRVRDRFVVSAPAAGRLRRVTLREGDAVGEGAVVALLDPVPLDVRSREEARARLDAAEAERRASDARVRQAREALAQARRDHGRADVLASQGLRAPGEREQAELAEATRARELDAARFAARAAAFQVEASRAVLIADEPSRRGLRSESPAIPVRSPVAGRVLRVAQESERSVAAGSPVLEVGDPGALEIVVDLLSTDAVKVVPGMEISADGGEGALLRGRVRTIEPSAFTKISALGVEEQRVNVLADLVDPAGRLGDGYRVEASIRIWEGNPVLKAPGSAFFRRGSGWCAFVVDRGRARRREVEIGHRGAREVEIVRGLSENETVILHPSDKIEDGVRVRAGGESGAR